MRKPSTTPLAVGQIWIDLQRAREVEINGVDSDRVVYRTLFSDRVSNSEVDSFVRRFAFAQPPIAEIDEDDDLPF